MRFERIWRACWFLSLWEGAGLLSRPRGGGADRDEGPVGGIPFKEDPNGPGRTATCRWEVPPERAGPIRKERNVPPWRTCRTNPRMERWPERAGAIARNYATRGSEPGGRVKREEFFGSSHVRNDDKRERARRPQPAPSQRTAVAERNQSAAAAVAAVRSRRIPAQPASGRCGVSPLEWGG